MDKKNEKYRQMWNKLTEKLIRAETDVAGAMRFSDLYDAFAHQYSTYVSPYIWVIPLFVTIVVVVTFKRAKLFGNTQKLLVFAIILDMSFTVFTGAKDGVLNFLDMNYGFVEYKICRFLILSFGIQGVIHGSSLLLKSIMMARAVLLFAFPIKFRNFRLKKWVAMLLFIHVILCAFSISFPVVISLNPIRTVQEYKHGKPLRIIEACEVKYDDNDFSLHFPIAYSNIMFGIRVFYFMLFPMISHCVCVVVLAVLLKKQIMAVKNLVADKRQRSKVKYLHLMKVSFLLGISFLVQEIPQAIIQVNLFDGDMHSISKFNSISYVMMSISFAFGKPTDILIYASQSKPFRTALSRWVCRNKKRYIDTKIPPLPRNLGIQH
jgi:hypothetical protein